MPTLPKNNNIGKRLSAAAEFAAARLSEREDKLFAVDVGTDHAKLPVYLAGLDSFCHITATDIAEGPCEIARNNISSCPKSIRDKITVVRTDGLQGLDDVQCNRVIIAGMGGELIRDILQNASFVRKEKEKIKFVLQPQTKPEILRNYLDSGYRILDERFVLEAGKYYVVISAVFDGIVRKSSLIELYFGRKNLNTKSEIFLGYFRKRYAVLQKNILAKKDAGVDDAEFEQDSQLLAEMKEYIKENGV